MYWITIWLFINTLRWYKTTQSLFGVWTSLKIWMRIDSKKMFTRTIKFRDSFFPSFVEWNGLDEILKKAINKKSFQSSLVKLVRPPKSNNFKILDKKGLTYLTQLRVGLNDSKRCKLDHNFDDTIAPMCSANYGIEDVTHFLLSCQIYRHIRIDPGWIVVYGRRGAVVKRVEHISTRRTYFDNCVSQHLSGAGFESRWFCRSGFEFAKTQLSMLNH